MAVMNKQTLESFDNLKKLVETILPTDNELGMEIQMRLDSFGEELFDIHSSIIDNQTNQARKRRIAKALNS